MYLRMHPLLVNVSLEDLDRASDMLKLSSFPPGTVLYPHRGPGGTTEASVYLITEGECIVRRRSRAGRGNANRGAESHG